MKQYLFLSICCMCVISALGQDPVYDNLVWADEFETPGAINSSNWHHQTQLPNGSSWYNNEIQHYTNRLGNSYVSNGNLVINARRETFTDQGVTKEFTSARLNSKFAFTYGRVEIRGKLPFGPGTWPAMWTLGQNIIEPGGYWTPTHGTTGWPACGELDIMEHWGTNQNYVQSAIHTPSSFGNTVNHGGTVLPDASTAFHIYEMIWYEDRIIFLIDGIEHYTYEPAVQNAETWPFTEDQYLLLNVAILPSISATFTESAMEIDYVRVYQETILDINEETLESDIKVFPNPVEGILTVSLPGIHVGATATVYSLLGQPLFSKTLESSTSQIDFSSLPKGAYLLTIKTTAGSVTKSIVK